MTTAKPQLHEYMNQDWVTGHDRENQVTKNSPVLIAFLTHINNAKSNKMYLKLAEKPLFTIFKAGFLLWTFHQSYANITSDAQ